MLEEEVVEMLMEELSEFLENYIIMTSFTHEAFKYKLVDQKSIEFGQYLEPWRNEEPRFAARHGIKKEGRTRLSFSFTFHKDERVFVMNLIRLLDGYVDYRLSNSLSYHFHFVFDVYSKANCMKFFNSLDFLHEVEGE